ncbi:MAG TPA: glycosyl transferase family 51, partial [Myxococcota bacterium]|nr:glycosyl transferase family 51 [Myxococcota bacterium]
SDFDASRPTLRTALRHSVNLPFVRLMGEIVDHLTFRPGGPGGDVLDDPSDPARTVLLERFVERESLDFLGDFVARHRGHTGLEREALLAERAKPGPWPLAVVYRWLHPDGDVAALHRFLETQLPGQRFHGDDLRRWHEQAGPRLSLADRGWITGIHPIELWLVKHWNAYPAADEDELRRASAPTRRESYAWLFRAGRRAQDLRIRAELERDAFGEIHAAWARTGYPFASLVPSLATAIGSSADRPAALAELLGILQSDGLRLATRRIEGVRLAENTPFETRLEATDARAERVLRPEVARAVREALVDVVENGTARRARGALHGPDGAPLVVGGKTGTGDDRRKRFARDGSLLSEEVASRSATLAFLIGDRHFGVLTAYVEGPEAGGYAFTSSLPAEVLRHLAAAIEPVLGPAPSPRMLALRPRPEPTRVAAAAPGAASATP